MAPRPPVKLLVCELLQFLCLATPLLVVLERFAAVVARAKQQNHTPGHAPSDASTSYWLIVAAGVAYVTSIALLLWLPLKYMDFLKRRSLHPRRKWRPVALAYVILCTLPCFAILIASAEVQVVNSMRYDCFDELPVSLVLFSLICIDIVERLRHCRLTGQANELDRDSDIPTLSHLEAVVTPVIATATGPATGTTHPLAPSAADQAAGRALRPGATNGATAGLPVGPAQDPRARGMDGRSQYRHDLRQQPSPASSIATATQFPPPYSGPLRLLLASDVRADEFGHAFLYWLDTAELLRAGGVAAIFFSRWVFPLFICGFLSCLRLVLTPCCPLQAPLGVLLQDLPFLILRGALLGCFGRVLPLLFLIKNLLAVMAYAYFNFMTKMTIFNTQRMF
ncbi:transmembrane protein 236-like [Engraulis encrasicolus]|uniref:transmembrane protein 236-like n=1 Tax=Engraulis encrasicolus TaxID=184585 RepID=UPI002FD3964E